MTVKRITVLQYLDRMEYLAHAAGPDLEQADQRARTEKNLLPLREQLIQISRYARECALYLEENP